MCKGQEKKDLDEAKEAREKRNGKLRRVPLRVFFERVWNTKKRKGLDQNLDERGVKRARSKKETKEIKEVKEAKERERGTWRRVRRAVEAAWGEGSRLIIARF